MLTQPLAATTTPIGSETFKLYYYAGAQPVAMRVLTDSNGQGAFYYIHTDHLGSTGKMTNAARQVVQAVYYEPFGRVRGVSTATGLVMSEPAGCKPLCDAFAVRLGHARVWAPGVPTR